MTELIANVMAGDGTALVASIGVAVAFLAVMLSTADSSFLVLARTLPKLRAAEEDKLDAALQSGDLTTLGEYLERSIGAFTVREYVDRPEVAQRLDVLLDRVQGFVGEPSGISEPSEAPLAAIEGREMLEGVDLGPVLVELERGETWNALARLRREIEAQLNRVTSEWQVSSKTKRSAGSLLREVERRGGVAPDAIAALRYAINVANRAVHGHEPTPDVAEEAVSAAVWGLRGVRDWSTAVAEGRDGGA